jgi:hypothetical protein
MPNKLYNDVHAKDTTKDSDGPRKGKDTGDRGSVAPASPSFGMEYTSQGSQEMKSGNSGPKKK